MLIVESGSFYAYLFALSLQCLVDGVTTLLRSSRFGETSIQPNLKLHQQVGDGTTVFSVHETGDSVFALWFKDSCGQGEPRQLLLVPRGQESCTVCGWICRVPNKLN